MHKIMQTHNVQKQYIRCQITGFTLYCNELNYSSLKAKFHYAIQLASSSLADRRPARELDRELDSVVEFGL